MPTEFTRHFFIEGRFMGSSKASLILSRHDHALSPPHGHAYFCPICARLWASLPVEDQTSHVWVRVCCKHQVGDNYGGWQGRAVYTVYQAEIPGSIQLPWEEELPAQFPPAVIEWEFLRHLERCALVAPPPIASAAQALYDTYIQSTKKARP